SLPVWLAGRLNGDKQTFRQFIRYVISGFTAFGFELSSFWAMETLLWPRIGTFETYLFGMLLNSKNVSNTLSMGLGFAIAFTLNRVWSFQSKAPVFPQFIKSLLLFLFNIVASNLLINLFVDAMGISKLISKVIQMAIIVMWNFILYKKVIYR
ncbi:MAG TPA: hypothetical protein DD727_02180, partial [Clostridiales bacterium]|nr:hypothetical protein [Clostridiales bacterium]